MMFARLPLSFRRVMHVTDCAVRKHKLHSWMTEKKLLPVWLHN